MGGPLNFPGDGITHIQKMGFLTILEPSTSYKSASFDGFVEILAKKVVSNDVVK